jgi:hypothetical protein
MSGWKLYTELVYDNGVVIRERFYRQRWHARLVAWWERNVSSWGGYTEIGEAS